MTGVVLEQKTEENIIVVVPTHGAINHSVKSFLPMSGRGCAESVETWGGCVRCQKYE